MTSSRISLLRKYNETDRQIHDMLYTKSGMPKAVLSFEKEWHEKKLAELRTKRRELYNQLYR